MQEEEACQEEEISHKQELATAGVSRGSRTWADLQIPAAPGLHQMRPRMPQQQAPTSGGQGVTQVMPYRQQVFPT